MTDKSVILGRPAGRNTAGKSPVSRNSDGKSPAAGPPHGNLSEEEIVAAALRVVHEDGLDKLSMRRLSRELGVSAMAPYYYVSDKRELLDLVATAALAGIAAPDRDGDWQTRLRTLIDQIDDRLARYPGLGEVLLEQMLRTQRHLVEMVMEILFDAGFSERNVLVAYGAIHTYLFGRSGIANQEPSIPDRSTLPEVIARAVRHLDKVHARDFYRFGAETLISGLGVQLDRQRSVSL
ncbi:mycofactocin system transcriptional regulator MftR2 [Rhodococcus kronopolitis]|uniref:Mycofactocin system transcriptional regulator MftR2 n=1 Tax=Rhodococcus kronopolitis TaxID=1460226 RepID=A0ABV9FWP9_9NOCA